MKRSRAAPPNAGPIVSTVRVLWGFAAAAALVASSCKESRVRQDAGSSPTASAANARVSVTAASASASASTSVDRSSHGTSSDSAGAALLPPPIAAEVAPRRPANAAALPFGSAWELVEVGAGPAPAPGERVAVRVSVWDESGRLAFSNAPRGSLTFATQQIGPELQQVLAKTRVGGRARLWLDERLRTSWLPATLPPGPLTFDVTLLAALPGSQAAVSREAPPRGP